MLFKIKNMVYKIGTLTLGVVGFIYVSNLIYNHISPWAGIIVGAFGAMLAIDQVLKLIKNQK